MVAINKFWCKLGYLRLLVLAKLVRIPLQKSLTASAERNELPANTSAAMEILATLAALHRKLAPAVVMLNIFKSICVN